MRPSILSQCCRAEGGAAHQPVNSVWNVKQDKLVWRKIDGVIFTVTNMINGTIYHIFPYIFPNTFFHTVPFLPLPTLRRPWSFSLRHLKYQQSSWCCGPPNSRFSGLLTWKIRAWAMTRFPYGFPASMLMSPTTPKKFPFHPLWIIVVNPP